MRGSASAPSELKLCSRRSWYFHREVDAPLSPRPQYQPIWFSSPAVLLADGAHLSLFVLVVCRDADVGGDVHGVFGHPNRTAIQYIKNGGFRISIKTSLFFVLS
jgi:hypothetical protein